MIAVPVAHATPGPTAQQTAWWWQDEVRTAAFALGRARSGAVSQWPRIAVPAGSAVLPVPLAVSPIRPDGRLDEPAWQQATSFPVGPVFDAFQRGPFMLQVSVCRDDNNLYLAVRSPRDLAGLGALSPQGELFSVGETRFRLGTDGRIPDACVARSGGEHVIELALPLAGAETLSFPVEMARRAGPKLPDGFRAVGLDHLAAPRDQHAPFRGPSLWLEPVAVRLATAATAVRLAPSVAADGQMTISHQVLAPGAAPAAGQRKLACPHGAGVYPYAWKAEAEGKAFSAEGFLYLEPVAEQLAAARAIARRSATLGSAKARAAPSPEELAAIEAETARLAVADASARRALYCRARELRARAHLSMLDAPLLVVKQHPYFAAHIYDTYYTWRPGGGVYVLDDPHAPQSPPKVRAVIDPATNETLGGGVYRDPDISWDARRLLFAHKPDAAATTSIYEIGLDGRGLKRLTASDKHHDIGPAWLPDGRIVFTSTRPRALVPCFNSGVDTLHAMNADGSGIRSISANNVTEFDPSIMPDGRILYGRWEYVDKTALYMQSLWAMLPDGRMEEALFANNLARPTAVLDPRPVPGARLVAASLTPHNGQPVGAIAMIDLDGGKNDLAAVFNFTPEYPMEMDQGLSAAPSEPWPLSRDDLLLTTNAIGAHGVIELVDRFGHRELVHGDPEISCFSPMLVKPRTRPPVAASPGERGEPGRFLVTDIYQGLTGVPRGSVKRIRIVEETARTSGIPPGGRWWNQAFLVSWQGAYIVKNILGVVPVHEDGSACFEVPPGKALYFEALDAENREVQRMRTFVQAAPGSTRSCIGCHENKRTSPAQPGRMPLAALSPPARPEKESWGSGYIDYPTMIQPVLDKYCVRCHGGPEGMGKGLDLSGGWTWAFSISYETLIKHRMTGFLNCNNASVHTSEILPPRSIGSGAAPLAEVLVKRHPELKPAERDVVLAWMDTNSNYYGTWDYTQNATCDAILAARGPLAAAMQAAGCAQCHAPGHVGNDWINLQTPEWSRILRAPMAKAKGGLGLEFCRKRKAREGYPLVDQSVQPPDVKMPSRQPSWDERGEKHVSFASTGDPNYQAMLAVIRQARGEALARPRIDMPGAEVAAGECRIQVAMPLPQAAPGLAARLREDTAVELSWLRTADTIGLQYELHRGPAESFAPSEATQIGLTTAGRFIDLAPALGKQQYALVVTSGKERTAPAFAVIDVPQPPPPAAPTNLTARPLSGEVALTWEGPVVPGVAYEVFRAAAGEMEPARVTPQPLRALSYSDMDVRPGVKYAYHIRAVDRRGQRSPASGPAAASPLPEVKEPVFVAGFGQGASAALLDGGPVKGQLHAGAKAAEGVLELGATGFATFKHLPEFDVKRAFSVECWVRIDREAAMPVVLCCGNFAADGWFLQRYAGAWRWHVAPASCDGGRPAVSQWTHLVGTFNGSLARLYQDGKLAASVQCPANRVPHPGPLVVGQYAQQAESYQVTGAIGGVRLYQRALKADEVAERFKAGRGK